MIYTDEVTKSFLAKGRAHPSGIKQLDDYQDPTYVGFHIKLHPSLNHDGDHDSLPQGLFCFPDPFQNKYSCYNYLLNRGETKRAEYILSFEIMFKRIVDEFPWYFTKISGLADSWKIDPKNNFRGKDKKLVIETLESIDLRMTACLDLYRKAVWDSAYMRWAVPDHMRYFSMEVTVSEIRPMKIGAVGVWGGAPNPGTFKYGSYEESGNNLKGSVGEMQADQTALGLYDTTAPWSAGTFLSFRYDECEIDVMTEAPAFLDSVGNTAEAPAVNKITIHTHGIHESNTYGLLGAIVDDTKYVQAYESAFDAGAIGRGGMYFPSNPKYPESWRIPFELRLMGAGRDLDNEVGNRRRTAHQEAVNGGTFSASPAVDPKKIIEDFENTHSLSDDFSIQIPGSANPGEKNTQSAADSWDADHKGELAGNGGGGFGGGFGGGVLGNLANNLTTGVVSAISNIATSAVNKTLLGNVYGISPLSLIGSAQSILNNPAAAIEAILRKHSSPAIGKELAKKVQLTGQEIQLVQSIIGASETKTKDTVKDLINNSDLVKNPGNANLSSAITKTKNPGKTNLDSVNINLNDPGKTILVGPNINSSDPGNTKLAAPVLNSNDPGKQYLRAPKKAIAKKENSNLTAFANAGGNPGKVEFEGDTVVPGKLGNANLEAPNVLKINLGKTEFND